MKRILLALWDKQADMYNLPFSVPGLGVAYRELADQIMSKKPDNMLALHPEDFKLVQLGFFDDQSGEITVDGPKDICELKDLVIPAE